MTPNQVDRYQILELLGLGGMGEVYRAYDPHLNREVVIKFINLGVRQLDAEWHERFRREVQAAGSLKHPHIVTVYDVALEHEHPYVVMELLTGGSLRERLKTDVLPWPEALSLLRPLADALAYAHRAGVIHRDVKPENVLFAGDEADTLKLVDFGLARRQEGEGLTEIGTIMGTPAYMSPEQALGDVVDPRTDIFALGIILYETIVGNNPLHKGTPLSTMIEASSSVQINLAPLNELASAGVVNLIKQAVAKNRDLRYPNCEALLADLDLCLANSGDPATTLFGIQSQVVPTTSGPNIQIAPNVDLKADVELVLRAMFNSFSHVAVETEFNRGFSGSRVFQIRLIERGGRSQLPAVVNIAPIGLILQEWQAYKSWVEHTLPNIARLVSSPTLPSGSPLGGLRYALVGAGTFDVLSLHDYYREAEADDLCWILEKRLFEIMGSNWWLDNRANRAFQMQTDYDRLLPVNLLIKAADYVDDEAYVVEGDSGSTPSPEAVVAGSSVKLKNFIVTEVDSDSQQVTLNLWAAPSEQIPISYRVRLEQAPNTSHYQTGNVVELIEGEVLATRHDLLEGYARRAMGDPIDLSAERLAISAAERGAVPATLPNPLFTYQGLLHNFITVNVSTVHGDLNTENILVDPATRDVSLIDFATVRQGHTLHDLLRLETEVVTKFIPPALVEAELPPETVYLIYERLYLTTHYPDHNVALNRRLAGLEKPYEVLRVIRKMAGKCLYDSDDWREYYHGLILYMLGVLKFKSLHNLETAPLPSQTAFWVAAGVQHLLDAPPSPRRQRSGTQPLPASSQVKVSAAEIESPFGTMRPDSKFYIERTVDDQCRERIGAERAVTAFIQAPRQMGKSSLMRRVLEHVSDRPHEHTAFVDFQKFPEHYYEDEKNFLIEFCLMIGDALELNENIDQYWQGRRTNIVKCSRYMSNYIVPQLGGSLILAMDEVDRMLTSPFRSNFFGMLRTWHNDRVHDESFANVTLFLCSSTEPYLFIENPNQSPFNVAEVFALEDFTRPEVEELNRRHNSPLAEDEVSELMSLVSGHPFLSRLALYLLVTKKVTDFQTLMTHATEDNGPFGDHLRYYLLRVLQKPELKRALAQICRDQTFEENRIFYRLKGAGLIKKEGQLVVFRNNLYDRYFKEVLDA